MDGYTLAFRYLVVAVVLQRERVVLDCVGDTALQHVNVGEVSKRASLCLWVHTDHLLVNLFQCLLSSSAPLTVRYTCMLTLNTTNTLSPPGHTCGGPAPCMTAPVGTWPWHAVQR